MKNSVCLQMALSLAISSALTHRDARIWSAMAQPTIMRVHRSMTVARYSHPSPVRKYVMSYADLRIMPIYPLMCRDGAVLKSRRSA